MSGGLVAVAFSDVVSSTELWSRLGDARADEVRRRLHLACEEAVVAVGGTLVKDMGDGVMATFPTASASIEGAVGLQQACASVARQLAIPELLLRVGVSIGEAYREGDDWHGVPVVEAARLAAVADDGQVLVTDAVLLLARQVAHSTTPLGARELKGLPEPVRVTSIDWSPLATSDVSLPSFLRRHDGDLPFTGRSAAVQQLRDSFDGAVARHLVVVSGEPGIGKTRLVGEFATEVAERGALVLAIAYEEGADVYHRSLGRALRTLAQRCEPPDSARAIVAMFGVGAPRPARPGDVDAAMVGDALAEWLMVAAQAQPVVVIADDLHWASDESLAVVGALASSLEDSPVLIVGTYRDTDLDRSHPLAAWLAARRREDPLVRIDLHGLDAYDTVAVLAARAGHSLDHDLLQLASELHRETEGNAFFLGQMVDHLFESGALVESGGAWRLQVKLDELGLPQGVREVVGRRLDRLPEGADATLATAAVQGREFSFAITRAAVDLDPVQVVDVMEALESAGLIRADGSSRDRFHFVHAIVRDTVLEELPTLRRSRVHLRVAQALDAANSEPSRAIALKIVSHYGEAAALGGLGRAVDLLPPLASINADVGVGLDTADVHRAAMRLLDAAAEVGLDDRRLVVLNVEVSRGAFFVRNDRELSGRAASEAVRLAERVDDPELFALAVSSMSNATGFGINPQFIALAPRALAGIDPKSVVAGDLRGALILTHSLFALPGVDPAQEYAELLDDFPDAVGTGLSFIAMHHVPDVSIALNEAAQATTGLGAFGTWPLARVDLDAATRHLDRMWPIVERADSELTLAVSAQCRALLAIARGEFDRAAAHIDDVERMAGHEPMFAVGVPWQRFRLAQWRGDVDDARRQWASAAATPYFRQLRFVSGAMAAADGDRAAAEAMFDEGWADGLDSLGRDWMYTATISAAAELAIRLGRVDEAAQLETVLAPFEGQFILESCISLLGSAAWMRGGLARTLGDVDGAAAHYQRALEFETTQGAAPMAARTRADLDRVLALLA